MNSEEFKNVFSEVAKANGFEKAFGGWFKESPESIVVIDLQKSNFGDYYELNIKIYVQGMFGNRYTKSKNLVKKDTGDIFRRHPPEYKNLLDFDTTMDDTKRRQRLVNLFGEFITPFSNKAATKIGIRELAEQQKIFLLPAVKQQLGV